MPRSALVVTVEAAEAIVASYRLEHDRMAARGVPAHVTVLHPFRSLVDDDAASRVAAIVRGVAPFMATFTSFGRFADGAVLFLAPFMIFYFALKLWPIVYGFWNRWEPRPPERDIDLDLIDLCLWIAEVCDGLDPEHLSRVLARTSGVG